jgi:thioredoxin-related protein
MKLKLIFLLFLSFATGNISAQLNTVHFEEIENLQQIEKRNIIVFIYADWCKYCKVMQNKTFKNNEIVKILNEKYYFISFNAESRNPIQFNGQTFNFKANGVNSGIHELAVSLGTINNQVAYPSICILNNKNEIIFQHNSFLNTADVSKILKSAPDNP